MFFIVIQCESPASVLSPLAPSYHVSKAGRTLAQGPHSSIGSLMPACAKSNWGGQFFHGAQVWENGNVAYFKTRPINSSA